MTTMDLRARNLVACQLRRERLAVLAPFPFRIFAGSSSPRNYAANPHAFRASSHFLYLIGEGIEHAVLEYTGSYVLYAMAPTEDDALWHGASETLEAMSARLGIQVRPLDSLKAGPFATVPHADAAARSSQGLWLERPVEYGQFPGDDQRLANAILTMRLQHDELAIDCMRDSAAISHLGHVAAMRATIPGNRVASIRGVFDQAFSSYEATHAYQPIITTRGEVLHQHAHEGLLDREDFLLCDVGAEAWHGFASDVTRTWPVLGHFEGAAKRLYEAVLDVQIAAVEGAVAGVRYRDLHLRACKRIAEHLVDMGVLVGDPEDLVEQGVHALFFPHGLGHLIGLDVHDMEDFWDLAGYQEGRSRSSQFGLSYLRLDRDLQEGMAVTIEPGIYFVPAILEAPRFAEMRRAFVREDKLAVYARLRGIRIEDDVLIRKEGNEVLSASIPKSIQGIEAELRWARESTAQEAKGQL